MAGPLVEIQSVDAKANCGTRRWEETGSTQDSKLHSNGCRAPRHDAVYTIQLAVQPQLQGGPQRMQVQREFDIRIVMRHDLRLKTVDLTV